MNWRTRGSSSVPGCRILLTGRKRNLSCIPTGLTSCWLALKPSITFYFLFRNANVSDLFIEAKSSGQLETGEDMLGNLRLVEIISNKIFSITKPDQTLESLQVGRSVADVNYY